MSALPEFLLARIAEDEAAWSGGTDLATRPDFAKLARHMLADCDAKRQIVDLWIATTTTNLDTEWGRAARMGLWIAVKELAAAYSDHPDYCEDWP